MKIVQWLSIGFAVLTVIITIVFFGWWAMREHFVFGHEPFSQVRWMSASAANSPACDRGEIVLDLQHRLLNPGMTREQATTLLGRPAWEEQNQYEYDLGVCQWVVHGLRLFFDPSGHLTHTAIVQH